MEIYQYVSLAVVSSLSISVGAFIASQSEEELKDGSRYIKTLIAVISYLVLLLTANKLTSNILLSAFIPTILILMTFYIPKRFRNHVFLFFLALCFSIMNKDNPDFIISSLIFIIGICIGSMVYYSEKNILYKSISIKTLIFIATALMLSLL